MATYKLIQDIEAEDKILGPLTLRQFIFALISVFFFYLSFLFYKFAAILLIVSLPPALFFGFFAVPFGRDQPTEIWFLAKLRFWFLPRTRIWDQSGVKELVTITVPKKIERILTNGLSETEVKSRLQALANTIDSRGWAIKNINVYGQAAVTGDSDRLIDLSSMPQQVPDDDDVPANDILDPLTNPVAHQMDSMVAQSAQAHHQKLMNDLSAAKQPVVAQANDWFMTPGASAGAVAAPVSPANPTPGEKAWAQQLQRQNSSQDMAYEHMRTVLPLGQAPATQPGPGPAAAAPSNPAILALARNDDLNVATLAREAHKARGDDVPDAGHNEVVIPLR